MAGKHIWDIRNPDGGANGLEFARAKLDAHDVVLAHALPTEVDVTVRDEDGELVAYAAGLRDDAMTPMARLVVEGQRVLRNNCWPTPSDAGTPVILCGGEAGILQKWWNAEDRSEWRWSIELYNHA
jgi:hypothetical protein